jgi:hypothetical protein
MRTLFDVDLIPWIQKVSGYFLTGRTVPNVVFVVHGDASTGKTVYVNMMLGIMMSGFSSCISANTEELRLRDFPDSHCRMLVISGCRRNVKSMVKKYIKNCVKPLVIAREQFQLGKDIIGRTIVLPFHHTFVPNPVNANDTVQDPHIIQTLRKNHEDEFFTWCVKGAIEFYKNPSFLPLPTLVEQATKQFIHESS